MSSEHRFSPEALIALRRKASAQSAVLGVIDENIIRRVQEGVPELAVERAAVTAIEERAGYGMAVIGSDRRRAVPVPFHIERHGALRAALAEWHPIQPLWAIIMRVVYAIGAR